MGDVGRKEKKMSENETIKQQQTRKPEPWELGHGWLWACHGGVWHVVSDVVLSVDGEYRNHLVCGKWDGRHPHFLRFDTGFYLKNNGPYKRFCAECKSWILTQLMKDANKAKSSNGAEGKR